MRYPVTILWCFGVSFSVQADSGEGRLLNFLSRTVGGCCPNKKRKGRRNAISIYIPVTNSFAQNARFREQIPGKPHTHSSRSARDGKSQGQGHGTWCYPGL